MYRFLSTSTIEIVTIKRSHYAIKSFLNAIYHSLEDNLRLINAIFLSGKDKWFKLVANNQLKTALVLLYKFIIDEQLKRKL